MKRTNFGPIAARRGRVLAQRLAAAIPADHSVLDVGCGDGYVASLILDQRPDLSFRGIDVAVREDTGIPVEQFDGERLPFEDRSFDCVMFVDVLHHTDDPNVLLQEARRVARKSIVIKDHLREGFLGQTTLAFMDYVSNARHGTALPYTFLSQSEWNQLFAGLDCEVEHWTQKLGLYPLPFSWLFDRSLHFVTRLATPSP